MTAIRMVGIVLFALGLVALAYGGFRWTEEKTAADLGPVEIEVQDEESVAIPLWASLGAVLAGGALLAWGGPRRA